MKLDNYIYPVSKGVTCCLEENDCVIRAVCNIGLADYETAHEVSSKNGRTIRKCCTFKTADSTYKHFGLKIKSVHKGTKMAKYVSFVKKADLEKHTTVSQFINENPSGKFICITKTHAFAVVDSCLVDKTAISKQTKIVCVYEVI
jgi:hypothetical protein